MSNVKALQPSRALYNDLLREYPRQSGVIITDSYLRLEQSVQGTITNVIFQALVNNGAANNTEKRLAMTDKFCACSLSVMIFKAGGSTAATQAEISVSQLRTFPNAQVFTGASEALNLHSIYNGSLSVRIDGVVYIDSLDVNRFYRVPTAQKGLAASTVAVTGVIAEDGYDNMNYGFSPLTPTIMMNGRGKNDIQIQLPNPTNTAGTASQNFVVCYIRGFLLQNAAKGS